MLMDLIDAKLNGSLPINYLFVIVSPLNSHEAGVDK